MEKFICGLNPAIYKDVMVGPFLPQTYNEALSQALKAKVCVQTMAKEVVFIYISANNQKGPEHALANKSNKRKRFFQSKLKKMESS